MKFLKIITLLFSCATAAWTNTAPTPVLSKPEPKIIPKQVQATKVTPAITPIPVSATRVTPTHVPYFTELQKAKMSPAILAGWQQLYQQFLQASTAQPGVALTKSGDPSSPVIPDLIRDPDTLKNFLSTNFFNLMAQELNPATFPKFTNDPNGQIHWNYATTHLHDTVTRLGSIASITVENNNPTVNFTGDCRDMGIIVNIQNNTQAQFKINQTSLDGKTTIQIGELNPGLNEVNLHTAALQTPTTKGTQQPTATTNNYFEIVENATDPSINISLKVLSGKELVTFLQSLPNTKKDTIDMNGLPTSSKYLATPQDWYLVLMQNPSASEASQPNIDQRIQAINLSKLSGPYLLSMQINNEAIKIAPITGQNSATTMNVFQPSITTVLEVKNKIIATKNYPLIILPQFLWTNSTLQAYWMLENSCLIATLSNHKFFGPKTFGDALQYFTGLGCFDMENKHVFVIDLYNLLTSGNTFHDATWLMGSTLYETNLNYCSDLPQLHSSQDSDGNIIANGSAFFYLNFQMQLHPQKSQRNVSQNLFSTKGFFGFYTQPLYQPWTIFCSILVTEIKDGVFAELTKIQSSLYRLQWTNKKNQILSQQFLYLNEKTSEINLSFINKDKNWTGSTVPPHLLNLKLGVKNNFKVTYESMPTLNKHLLSVQATSPIDKSGVIHTTYILKHPKTNQPIATLYYDLYEVFQSSKFTRCQIIENGNLPPFLSNLTQKDWENGIYIIPTVPNHENLTPQNPGSLTVTFYKFNKTLLGHIQSHGSYQNNPSQPGIRSPVNNYSMYSTSFNPVFDFDLSSGVLLKYSTF